MQSSIRSDYRYKGVLTMLPTLNMRRLFDLSRLLRSSSSLLKRAEL